MNDETSPQDRAAEWALVQRCRDGDAAAWRQLYREHQPRVKRFVTRLGAHEDAVEDLVQQTFMGLLTSMKRYRGEAALSTWLYRIASNLVAKAHRSATRQRRFSLSLIWSAGRTVSDQTTTTPEAQSAAREQLGTVERAAADLSPKLRTVWVMVELEQLTPDEVARALDIKPATVRSRLFEARKRVVERLAKSETISARPRLRVVAKTAEGER